VNKWSKLDTVGTASVDTLLKGSRPHPITWTQYSGRRLHDETCPRGHTARASMPGVFAYGGDPPRPEHGGPAAHARPAPQLLKISKWVRGSRLYLSDEPARLLGYERYHHNYCDHGRNAVQGD